MLIIRSSSIHAAGCFATAPIKKGTKLIEYTGPRISREEADRRYNGRDVTYLFGLDDNTIIDGFGMAAFINHSCDPNAETEEIDKRIWLMAIRDIKAGEEILYDYYLYDGEPGDAPCYCGSKNCRGTMFSEEEIERQKREAEKEKRAKSKRA